VRKRSLRLCCGRLALALLFMFQLTLPVVAEADIPDQPGLITTDNPTNPTTIEPDAVDPGSANGNADSAANSPTASPGLSELECGSSPEPASDSQSDPEHEITHDSKQGSDSPPDDNPGSAPDGSPSLQDPDPAVSQESLPAAAPPEDLPSDTAQDPEDPALQTAGNSYRAMVLPENGVAVVAGVNTKLTAIFTELSAVSLASAFLYIPDTLAIVDYTAVDLTEGWAYSWETATDKPGFTDILSFWAVIDSARLGKDQSVTAIFTVTATADQEHSFNTAAWHNRATEDGLGIGPGTTKNKRSTDYSEPGINVAVGNVTDFNQVRDNPHWHYLQQADIDLAGFGGDSGWQPIGTSTVPFSGSYNGGGYRIDNLRVFSPAEEHIGLFGYTAPTTMLTGINLTAVNISGNRYVGGLVGTNDGGIITNASVSGTIKANQSYAGGLVGHNFRGIISDCSTLVTVQGNNLTGAIAGKNSINAQIINSHAKGTVIATRDVGGLVGQNIGLIKYSSYTGDVEATAETETRVGGLVGDNHSKASICCSFAQATISAPNGSEIGGLVGRNSGSSITSCYSLGTVSAIGSEKVGGLAGLNLAAISNSYSAANVTGISNYGGLVGFSGGDLHTINNSFYSTSQHQNGFGTAVSDLALKTQATYSDATWNIAELEDLDQADPSASTWYIESGSSYPTLWWQHLSATEPGPNPSPKADAADNRNITGQFYYPLNHSPLPFIPLFDQPVPGSTTNLVLTGSIGAPGQPLISPGFVLRNGWNELQEAEAAYNQLYTYYASLTQTGLGFDLTLLQLDLALARAAILALRHRLSVDTTFLHAAQQAYYHALHLLNQNSHLLTVSQKVKAETILAKILSTLNQ
jgi:hypothetical protein